MGIKPTFAGFSADGSDSANTLLVAANAQFPHAFTPDGGALIFGETGFDTRRQDIVILPLQGERAPRPYLRGSFAERAPALSPNGQYVNYITNPDRAVYDVHPDGERFLMITRGEVAVMSWWC